MRTKRSLTRRIFTVVAGTLALMPLGASAQEPVSSTLDNLMAAFGIELVLSFVMMLVIIGAIRAEDMLRGLAPVPIGAVVGIEVMLFGGIAGAAMNPARAFGPTLALGDWSHFWIYLVGPIIGLITAGWIASRLMPE